MSNNKNKNTEREDLQLEDEDIDDAEEEKKTKVNAKNTNTNTHTNTNTNTNIKGEEETLFDAKHGAKSVTQNGKKYQQLEHEHEKGGKEEEEEEEEAAATDDIVVSKYARNPRTCICLFFVFALVATVIGVAVKYGVQTGDDDWLNGSTCCLTSKAIQSTAGVQTGVILADQFAVQASNQRLVVTHRQDEVVQIETVVLGTVSSILVVFKGPLPFLLRPSAMTHPTGGGAVWTCIPLPVDDSAFVHTLNLWLNASSYFFDQRAFTLGHQETVVLSADLHDVDSFTSLHSCPLQKIYSVQRSFDQQQQQQLGFIFDFTSHNTTFWSNFVTSLRYYYGDLRIVYDTTAQEKLLCDYTSSTFDSITKQLDSSSSSSNDNTDSNSNSTSRCDSSADRHQAISTASDGGGGGEAETLLSSFNCSTLPVPFIPVCNRWQQCQSHVSESGDDAVANQYGCSSNSLECAVDVMTQLLSYSEAARICPTACLENLAYVQPDPNGPISSQCTCWSYLFLLYQYLMSLPMHHFGHCSSVSVSLPCSSSSSSPVFDVLQARDILFSDKFCEFQPQMPCLLCFSNTSIAFQQQQRPLFPLL